MKYLLVLLLAGCYDDFTGSVKIQFDAAVDVNVGATADVDEADRDVFGDTAIDVVIDTAAIVDAAKDSAPPTCFDNTKNGSETDVDCGGGVCPLCAIGKSCKVNQDCVGSYCHNINKVCE